MNEEHADPMQPVREGMRHVAPIMAAYHSALIESGFSRDEAMSLVRAFQTDWFSKLLK